MPNQVSIKLTGALLLAALIALVLLVATSPAHFLYDEPYFTNYIPLLHRYGLTTLFMNSLTGTVGPLYAFVHIVLEPVTRLEPVKMRVVNVLLLAAVAGILAASIRGSGWPENVLAGCSVLVVPMTWVVAGMALSEMPAMLFVTLSLYLQLRGLRALEQGRRILGWFLVSGILLGIAVWGRQPYLLLSAVPALMTIVERRLRVAALLFAGVVWAMAIPLFVIWKGLTPPLFHSVQQGISLPHGLISLGYTGLCFLLLAPRSGWLPGKVLIGLVALTIAANAWLGSFDLYPVSSAAGRYLPAPRLPAYGRFCGSLFLSCGVVFLASLLWIIWQERGDLGRVTINAGLLCVAASPMFIADQYSSRYTAVSLPYLILAAQPWRVWRLRTALTALAGCALGFLSLSDYFSL